MATNLTPYLRAWRKRIRDEEAADRERAETGRQIARELARVLGREFRATTVWLFGSLVLAERGLKEFHERSDIDLAARGVPPELFFRAGARLEALTAFPVDLVDIDACSPALRESILREGVIIYEREKEE